jgi:predicted Fe-Mo cluster-binding NifX family protein
MTRTEHGTSGSTYVFSQMQNIQYISNTKAAYSSHSTPIFTKLTMTKLLCIVGITRNPASPATQHLSSLGIEIMKADLGDLSSLILAFQDANLIFSVANYQELFFYP